ncbi:MAG: hypothetical protein PHI88_02795 [Candidatus Pacebacteria bacterium]|nr:hypothetical protein [Candidatus Paceibacterota bacterium]
MSEIDVKKIKKELPELPQQKRVRFKKEYGLSGEEIETFVKQRELADCFESIVSEIKIWCKDKKIPEDRVPKIIKVASNYLQTDLWSILKSKKIKIKDLKITPENFAELVTILVEGKISSRAGKDILAEMVETGADPSSIIKEKNLEQVSDEGQIEEIAKKVISQNKNAVEDYKKGKENALQFLVGGIMRETKGKINPEEAKKVILKILKG